MRIYWFFIWTNLNPLHQRILVSSLVDIGPVVLQKNFVHVFLLFCNFLPLEKDIAFVLKKPESFSLKNALCQVWMKLIQWFLRRRWNVRSLLGQTDGRTDGRQANFRLSWCFAFVLGVAVVLGYGVGCCCRFMHLNGFEVTRLFSDLLSSGFHFAINTFQNWT